MQRHAVEFPLYESKGAAVTLIAEEVCGVEDNKGVQDACSVIHMNSGTHFQVAADRKDVMKRIGWL